jgi:hypothetical protein
MISIRIVMWYRDRMYSAVDGRTHGLTGIREMTTVGRLTRNPWPHHRNTLISVCEPRNNSVIYLHWSKFRGQLKWFRQTTTDFELSPRCGQMWHTHRLKWEHTHRLKRESVCIIVIVIYLHWSNFLGHNKDNLSDVSTDFELFVRSNFTDSCETSLEHLHALSQEPLWRAVLFVGGEWGTCKGS